VIRYRFEFIGVRPLPAPDDPSGPDRDSKTEEPTEKKTSDAREKGNVPHSREAATLASMLGVLIVIALGIAPVSLFGIQTQPPRAGAVMESFTWNR
jgi:uncharacterized protein HemX